MGCLHISILDVNLDHKLVLVREFKHALELSHGDGWTLVHVRHHPVANRPAAGWLDALPLSRVAAAIPPVPFLASPMAELRDALDLWEGV